MSSTPHCPQLLRLVGYTGLLLLLIAILLPHASVAQESQQGPSHPACQGTFVVLAADATVALQDTPENGITRMTIPVKQEVTGISALDSGGMTWCLVSVERGGAQGWLPSHQLQPSP